MNAANVVAVGAFFAILMAGLIASTISGYLRQRPGVRLKRRVAALHDQREYVKREQHDGEQQLLDPRRRAGDLPALQAAFVAWHERIQTVGGPGGLRIIVIASAVTLITALIGTSFASLNAGLRLLVCMAVPLLAVRTVYAWMIARFRQRFLAAFPDTLDLIIRAVRAGIPVVQAICTAGTDSAEPVRSTFRTIGDALLVGAELKDVLERAAVRLQVADFSFFTVCLILQRETGGNLGDTLENLAGIVRTRRDVRAKSKALTAEGRLASKMIAAVPFTLMGFLYLVNKPYLDVLMHTRAGHKILALAAVLLSVGLWMINKISNLDTSR
ncbi:pilus assembly protein [Paraburkholderia steynii]|uniref:Pilus assembly protein n=1 Tax=Paraburkholderia steynii TaxID=1245441 RepID=A0A4R0XGF7_9BURK|nr:pilus assembly protein [Paraburkholderia steynii]